MDEAKYPLVSIVIPAHNRADLLPRAIRSAAAQSYPNIEIIVVDDGSKDETPALVNAMAEQLPNLVYLRNELPQGVKKARNKGIAAASGTYVTFCDDDDELVTENVETQLSVLRNRPELSFVIPDYREYRTTGSRVSKRGGEISLEKLLWVNICYIGLLAEKEKLIQIGGFDELQKSSEDYDLCLRLIDSFGPAYRIPKVLYIYHLEHRKSTILSDKRTRRMYLGYFRIYNKFKSKMTQDQRKYQLYKTLWLRGSKISPAKFLKMVPSKYWAPELNMYLIEKTNFNKYFGWLRGF
ncbi:MAG: glycosyltransferase family A protein [Bacteroidota bacterium]